MAGFQDAVGNISRGAQAFKQDPFLVGANAFVPLNSQLQYEKNLMGVWADADTQQGKIAATNALNHYKATDAEIGRRKLLGSDEAVRAQTLYMQNADGTFRPVEEAALSAFNVTADPYARANLYQTAQQGALNTAAREAFMNPEHSLDSQQVYGVMQRGYAVEPTADGRYRVTDGVRTFGTYSPAELGMILSGTGNASKVGAHLVGREDFDQKAATQFDYNTKLNEQKHQWNMEVAKAGAEGKAVSAQVNAKVKALESFQKFATDNGLIQAASSGDEQALRQLASLGAYTEQAYGLQPGSITSAFVADAPEATIKDNTEKVGAAFNTSRPTVAPVTPAPVVPVPVGNTMYWSPSIGGGYGIR